MVQFFPSRWSSSKPAYIFAIDDDKSRASLCLNGCNQVINVTSMACTHFSRVDKRVEVATEVPRSDSVTGGLTHVRLRRAPVIEKQKLKMIDGDSNDIDKRAEAFIQRFKGLLETQQMPSLENYESLLERGI